MFCFPFFPDDALCMAAGLTKMKYRFFIPTVLIFRTTGVATICFLGGVKEIFDVQSWSLVTWLVVINLVIFDVFALWQATKWLEKKIESKKEKKVILNENEKNA